MAEPEEAMSLLVGEGEPVPLLLQPRVVGGMVLGFVAVLALAIASSLLFGVHYEIDAGPLRDRVDALGIWGPVLFVALMALSVLFAPIPNVPIFLAAGLTWGPVTGTAYSLAGLILGSAMAFWAARLLGRRHLPRLVGNKTAARMDHAADKMGGTIIFWARMLPAVSFDWISFIAGMTSMRFSTFIVASAFGMVIPTALAVTAGDGLGRDDRILFAMSGIWVSGVAISAWMFRRQRGRARR